MIDIQHPDLAIGVRPTIASDAKAIYEIRTSQAVAQWQYRLSDSDHPEKMASLYDGTGKQLYEQYFWSVLEGERLIGHVTATRCFQDFFSLGFNLHGDYWARGIMPRSIRVVMNDLYSNHSARGIWCYCFSDNQRVQRMFIGLGFKQHALTLPERFRILIYSRSFRSVIRFVDIAPLRRSVPSL